VLQQLLRVPTDTPPGNNAPHAEMVADLVKAYGWNAEKHAVPAQQVRDYGMESITNLIVRRPYGGGPTVALNAHGDVVPPGDNWTYPPYGGVVDNGYIYGRAAAVSKCDFATYIFATRALEALGVPLKGGLELHFTYDEEFGGLLGPGWLLEQKLTKPDYVIAAGFSYNIVTAHNACLQLEITVHGKSGHGAMPETGHDALQAATRILNAIYGQLPELKKIKSKSPASIADHAGGPHRWRHQHQRGAGQSGAEDGPPHDPGRRSGGSGSAGACADRERGAGRAGITWRSGACCCRTRCASVRARKSWCQPPAECQTFIGEKIPAQGTPLYADARLYGEHGIPAVLYGAGPRTVPESNAKKADERLLLEDLRKATKVVAFTLLDMLAPSL
jgi:acetylornithine deacetylase/succinyl-diaminopimelate desuccinylase-like protein